MTHSESIAALAAALAKAQGELMGAKKDVNNPFFKSKYADLASTVEALKAAFPKHGLSYVQTICTEDHGAGVITMLLHSSGEWIKGERFCLPVNKQDAQGFGSCVTYARRYSLAAISGVAPEDDDGNAAAAAKPKIGELTNKILPAPIPANTEGYTLYDNLPVDAKTVVQDDVAEMSALVKAGNLKGALDILNARYVSHEDQLILASQMDSGPRNKIKAFKRSLELASQP